MTSKEIKTNIKKDLIKAIAICEHGLDKYNKREFKNNNPGNIVCSSWCNNECDGRFCKFRTYDDGFKAMEGLLKKNYGNMTIQSAIYKYAPPIENNTNNHLYCIKQYGMLSNTDLVKDVL